MDDLLHPVFLVMLEHPFDICDWAAWSAAFHSLSKHHRRVAAAVGVTRECACHVFILCLFSRDSTTFVCFDVAHKSKGSIRGA